jgi:hypothetical protein
MLTAASLINSADIFIPIESDLLISWRLITWIGA